MSYNFVKRNDLYTKEDEQFLIDNYQEKGPKYCAEHLKRSTRALAVKCNKLGLSTRSKKQSKDTVYKAYENYSVNPNVFIKELTPASAYILGFLWADGHILKNKQQNRINLTILESDFLEISQTLDETGIWRKRAYDRGGNRKRVGVAEISNKPLVDYLIDKGYGSKSYESADLILKSIPDNLIHFWFRGLFDGDGGVYFNPSGQHVRFNISSGYNQDWGYFEKLFQKLGLVNYKIKRRISKQNYKCSIIEVTSRTSVIKFLSYIYQNREIDQIGLTRKYKSYLRCLEIDKRIREKFTG